MTCIAELCFLIAAFGSLYMLVAALVVARFASARRSEAPGDGAPPPVTLLKPLHGEEPNLFENLASFCVQDYAGPVQIVFGVQNRADPAVAVVHRLMQAYPDQDIDLVVDAALHGSNGKVSNLINMSPAVRNEIVIVSDSDIRVDTGYLSRIVAELERPGVGGVTCLYHGEPALGRMWSRLSALAINGHFLANVIVGMALGLARPCFGSTIAVRRQTLAGIGGFAAFADDLADDYAIGVALREAGYEVAIPPITVGHACVERTAAEMWRHEIRWARTIRILDPIGFAGTIVSYPVLFALIGAVLAGFDEVSLAVVAAALVCRIVHCAAIARIFKLAPQSLWLVPIRDVLSFAGFLWSFVGGAVSWKGHDFKVLSDGTLVPSRRSAVH